MAVDSPKHIIAAGKAIRHAFDCQVKTGGFSFVEVLSTCPTNWGMDALKANARVEKEMIPYFPLGVYKDASRAEEGE